MSENNRTQEHAILDLDSIATKVTEMGATPFWGDLFRHIATEKGFDNGLQKVVIGNHPDCLLVAVGEFAEDDAPEVKTVKALDCEMTYTTFREGVIFLIPIKNEEKMNEQKEEHKPKEFALTEEVASRLKELDVDPSWISFFMNYVSINGFKASLPELHLTATENKVYITFGDPDSAAATGFSKLKLNAFKSPMEWAININGGVFHIPRTEANGIEDDTAKVQVYLDSLTPNNNFDRKKETKMSNERKPADTDLIWKKFREQLEAAKLSQQSIDVIMRTLRDDTGLKKPTAESVLLCTKSRNVTNVFYSHDGKHVTLTDAEKTHLFDDRETLSYGAGHYDAFFIADTSKVKTFEEKMIHRHVGVPKIALNLSNGKSIELPFKNEYIGVAEDMVTIRLDCDVVMCLSNRDFNSITGPALTDLNETQKDRYFVNGTEYTLEEFNRKVALWKKEGIIPNIE